MDGLSFKDISAAASLAVSDALQSTLQYKGGSVISQLGSGTLNAKLNETQTASAQNTADAKSNATAASGGGSATAPFTSAGGAGSSGALPTWAIIAALGIAGLGVIFFGIASIGKGKK